MERRARIVVIGSTNTDMVVKVPRIPAPGETILGGTFTMVPGGKGANQALAAARLGAEVTFVGCVGEDDFGRSSLLNLRREGVDLQFCQRTAGVPSGVALIAVDDAGQNAIVVAPGANNALTPDMVNDARPAIEAADVLVLQCEIPLETVEHAARVAKDAGTLVVLNPAPACALPASLLELVDVLTPNESEAQAIVTQSDQATLDEESALAASLLERGVRLLVLTLGARGCLAATLADGIPVFHTVPAFPVKAVDATAAGDCFTAALATALAERGFRDLNNVRPTELAAALSFATAAAALSVTRLGAQPSLPYRHEVLAFLDSHGMAHND